MREDDILLAGELALGVLDGEDRAAALRRVVADPDFAAEVAAWRRRLAGLTAAIPKVEPPAVAEHAILAATRVDRRAVGRWRAVAVAASLIAAALALPMVWPGHAPSPVRQARSPVLVAALAGADGSKPFSALYDRQAARVAVIGAAPWPAGRSAELWLIPPGAKPRPLGLLPRSDHSSVAVGSEARLALSAGATLAISIEPSGGSPTGQPTGPVVASGTIVTG